MKLRRQDTHKRKINQSYRIKCFAKLLYDYLTKCDEQKRDVTPNRNQKTDDEGL